MSEHRRPYARLSGMTQPLSGQNYWRPPRQRLWHYTGMASEPTAKRRTKAAKEKKPPSPLQIILTQRLKAVQAELGATQEEMADRVGCTRSAWSNWLSKGNMPEETAMVRLCGKTGIRMDWLYRGDGDCMPAKLLIRLELRIAGIDPDKASPEEVAPVAAQLAVRVPS